MANEIVEVKNITPKKVLAAKIIAIIAFSLVMFALVGVLVSDIIIFAAQIMMFIAAIFGAAITFIFGLMLFIVSVILIFGFYIAESYGFWPLTWAENTFHEIIADAKLTAEQISIITGVRIAVVAICVISFVLAIVCLAMKKSAKKAGYSEKQKLTGVFGILSLIFGILGVLVNGAIVALISFI